MQKSTAYFYNDKFRNSHVKKKHNPQWNQNFRPPGPYLQNNQNCDYQYWCETCDKGFTTERFLENHKLQHQKCNIDGCQFIAHPKIITKHIQMQHSTGLFKRIAKLNNPEDIEKWKQERKRKYPTIENINKKQAEIKEKINRGEKMGIKYSRDKNNYKSGFNDKSNQKTFQGRLKQQQGKYSNEKKGNRKRTTDSCKKSEVPKKIYKTTPLEETRKLKPFAGIETIRKYNDKDEELLEAPQCNYSIEDDEDTHNTIGIIEKNSTVSESTVCSALTSLICSYGSSDEDNSEMPCNQTSKELNKNEIARSNEIRNENKIVQTKHYEKDYNLNNHSEKDPDSTMNNVSNCQGHSDEEGGPEEIKIVKEGTNFPVDISKIPNPTNLKKKELSSKQINRGSSKRYEFIKRNKLPSTLLEKLLHREIQHERNVILQCVRYVVKDKYFENI